jgi:3-phenylpropionate/trans-cinnamate dioxygenase ferredoxin subunit
MLSGKSASEETMDNFVKAAKTADVPPGELLEVWVGGVSVALCNVQGEMYAIENVCTHDGGLLDAGMLEDYEVECPRHGARFDVRSGAARALPAVASVASFPVRVRGDDIEVAAGAS